MADLRESVAAAGRMWGGADYERVARRFASIHDDLAARLSPARGERCLDVGSGTGEVALRLARAGADVTAVDISAELLALARAKPEADRVAWKLADAQDLPFEDEAFDVVVSCFAVIFAPDPGAAARELGRVCRPGGRLGLTSWRPNEGPHAIYDRFAPSESSADEWGSEDRVEELLGGAFELEFDEGVWHLTGESPEAVLELMAEGAPPLKALLATLGPDELIEFRKAMIEYWEGFRTDGGIAEPRHFLIVEGRRR